MKIKVTRQDIEDGRESVNDTCGCPIYHALNRKFQAEGFISVNLITMAQFGKIKIPLPKEAVEFQRTLIKNAFAEVKPFTFETEPILPV